MDDRMKEKLDAMRVNPNPRVVALLDYALDQIIPRLSTPFYQEHSGKWLEWAKE